MLFQSNITETYIQEMQFEFPSIERQNLLREVKSVQELKRLLNQFKGTEEFACQSIAFNILMDNHPDGLQHTGGLTVEFTCCGSQYQKPIIHFQTRDNKFYFLQKQSKFKHKHTHNLNKVTQKSFSFQENLLRKQNYSKNNQIVDNSHEDYDEQMFGTKKENSCNNDVKNQQEKKAIQKLFEFPTHQQRQKLKYVTSKQSMEEIILRYLQNPIYKDKRIQFSYSTQIERLRSGYQLQNLRVNFNCCLGINSHLPFLDYIKISSNKYEMIDNSTWHDHRQIDNKKAIRQKIEQTKQVIDQNFINGDNLYNQQVVEQISNNINGYEYSFEERHPSYEQKSQQLQMYSDEHINNIKQDRQNRDDPFLQEQMQQEKQYGQKENNEQKYVQNQSQSQIDQRQSKHPFKQSDKSNLVMNKTPIQKPLKRDRKKYAGHRQLRNLSININSFSRLQNEDSVNNENNLHQPQSSQKHQNLNQNSSSSNIVVNQPQSINKQKLQSKNDSQLVFQFPNKKDIKKLAPAPLTNIRNSVAALIKQNKNKNLHYQSKTFDSQNKNGKNGKNVHNLHFYFDCCKGTQNTMPFLHFVGKRNSIYTLKQFNPYHNHSKQSDKKQNLSQKIASNTNKISQNTIQNISQQNTEINSQNNKRLYLKRANYASKQHSSVFEFPSIEDSSQIKPFSVTSIRSDLKRLSDRKRKHIEFHSQTQNKENIKFYFDCCKGFENCVPFLHFRFNAYEQQYLLISSNRWHDHRKIVDEKNKKQRGDIEQEDDKSECEQEEPQEEISNQDESDNEDQHYESQESQQQSQEQDDDEQSQSKEESESQQSEQNESQSQDIQQQKKLSTKRGKKRDHSRVTANHKIIRKQTNRKNQNQPTAKKSLRGFQIRAYWKSKLYTTVFEFPSNEELKRLNRRTLKTIHSTVSKMVNNDNKKKCISYVGKEQEVEDKSGRKCFHYIVKFNCCEGFQNHKSFIHFVRKNDSSNYQVKEIQKWHDHSKRQEKQKQIKEDNKVKPQSIKQKEQNTREKIVPNGKKQILYQKKPNDSPRRTKKISKIFRRITSQRIQHEQSDLITSKKKNSNQIDPSSSEEQIQQQQQSFEQSSIIEISSKDYLEHHRPTHSNKTTHNDQVKPQTLIKKQNPPSTENVPLRNQMIEMPSKNGESQTIIKSGQMIYYWLQRYSQKFLALLMQKQVRHHHHDRLLQPISNNFAQQMRIQFLIHFPQPQQGPKSTQQSNQLWTQCILQILSCNKFYILSLQTNKQYHHQNNSENIFELQNLLFLSNNKQHNDNLLQLYLAVYPITISQKQSKIFIAYTVNFHQANLQILWFYIFTENYKNIKFEDFLNDDDCHTHIIDKILNVSIKYFGLRNVNFIFTNLDYQIMLALDKLCIASNSLKKSQINNTFASTMHFTCIDELSKNQSLSQNSQLGNQIGKRIRSSSNFSDIKTSYKVLKTILSKDTQKNAVSLNNPRIIYDCYRKFIQLFSNNNKNQEGKLNHGIGFFSSQLLYQNNMDRTIRWDFIDQLNETFSNINQFNHAGQVMVMIIKFFDQSFRKVNKMAMNSSIIPLEFYEVQRQITNFNSICSDQEKLPYSIQKIFSDQSYNLLSLIKQCPYFITQTIYKLIITANELILSNQYEKSAQGYLCHDAQTKKIFRVKPQFFNKSLRSYHHQLSIQSSKDSNKERQKGWQCSCKFSIGTGLPCEHQILAVLDSKSSLYKEVSYYWKKRKVY